MCDGCGYDETAAITGLPETERAAAIMHFIYMETIRNPAVDWETRLAPTWAGLDERAKNFNRAILETWRRHPELIAMWLAAVERLAGSELPSQTPESAHELA